jgi:glycine oxidase
LSESSNPFDLAVIGGGVIGLSVAWRAARRGLRTVVLERGRTGEGTSHVAAGMLAPAAEADPGEQSLLALGLRSARAYPDFVRDLTRESGRDPGYTRCGALFVARDADEAEALERELQMRLRLGLAVERLRPSAARALEPALTPALRLALDLPEDHVIDPRALTRALVAALGPAGAVVREHAEVDAVCVSEDGVDGVRLRGAEHVAARQVVLAAGVWSNAIDGIPAHARVAVRPVKGQVLRMHDPAGPGLLTRVIRILGGYITPRGDGRYVIGGTMEERGMDTAVTAGALFAVLRDAIELVPGVAELVVDELSAGLRPGTADNSPVIGPAAVRGLHWATGHHRSGILLAPVTAEIVVAGLLGEPVHELAGAFGPERFSPLAAGRPT